MALVPDQKFSTFQDGGDLTTDDIIVGLRDGINTKFTYTGDLPPGVIVPISQGGTGATTAAGARTNLGLGTMAVQNANAVSITGGSAALGTGSVVASPVAGIDIANKTYVDSVVAGSVTSAQGTANQVLINGATTVQTGALVFTLPQSIATTSSPTFAALTLTTPLTVPNGGSGLATLTAYTLLAGGTTSTGVMQQVGAGNAGQLLQSNGAAALPSWTTATFPSGSGTLNHILRSDGTNWVESTATTLTSGDALAGLTTISASGAITSGAAFIATKAATNTAIELHSYVNNTNAPFITMLKSRSITGVAGTAVQNGDPLGTIQFAGDDGTNFLLINTIRMSVSGSVSTGIIPTQLVFSTTNTSGSVVAGLTISNAQIVTLANALPSSSGGTGVNNGSNTLTLAGNLATSGAFASTFTMTGATNVTFPTSGTLATTASASGIVNSGTAGQLAYYAGTGTTISGTNAGTGVLTALGNNATGSGGIVLATSPTITTPIIGQINDTASLPMITFLTAASAVNYVQLNNQVTGAAPGFTAKGSDTNVGINLVAKAAGQHNILSTNATPLFIQNGTGYQRLNQFTFPDVAGNFAYTFPAATGTIALTATTVSNATGTANQILINGVTTPQTGALTFTLPQSIGTASALTFGSVAFSSTSGIIGTTTNDSAASGSVGQYYENIVLAASAVSLTTTVAANICTIALDAGDYDVWGNIIFQAGVGTAVAGANSNITTASATLSDIALRWVTQSLAGGTAVGSAVPSIRVSLSAPGNVYLVAQATFSVSTLTACGALYARRRR